MSSQADGVARILKCLQGLVRRPPSGEQTVHSGRVPEDIATEGFRWLYLRPDEERSYQEAQAILLSDPRFEYLERRKAVDALWRFLCQCYADRTHDHISLFIAEYTWEILDLTCYLPVEHLTVKD